MLRRPVEPATQSRRSLQVRPFHSRRISKYSRQAIRPHRNLCTSRSHSRGHCEGGTLEGFCGTPHLQTPAGGTIMAGKAAPNIKGVRIFPPPPKGFDALAATKTALTRHGLPQRPDPRTQPELAALWEQRARRYQDFEHLKPELIPADKPTEPVAPSFGCRRLNLAGLSCSTTPVRSPSCQEPGRFRT